MNRRRGIWLFPFFNIMICVIGVLLLMGASVVGFSLDATGIVSTNAVLQSIDERNAASPIYVEWDGKQAIIHPSMATLELDIPLYRIGDGSQSVLADLDRQVSGSYLGRVIQYAQQTGGGRYVVVLVRPTGFDNFIFLREFFLSKGIDLGYEPVGQYWEFQPSGEPCF